MDCRAEIWTCYRGLRSGRYPRTTTGYRIQDGWNHAFLQVFNPSSALLRPHSTFSALSNLYHFYSLYSARKYVEQFKNGITIISLYLNPLPAGGTNAPPIEHSIFQVMKEASLLYCLPDNPFFLEGTDGDGHAVQEATYACTFSPFLILRICSLPADCGWIFAQHFCNRLGPSYLHLKNVLDENDPAHAEVLNDIKRRFREETFTRESIAGVIQAYPELVRWTGRLYDWKILRMIADKTPLRQLRHDTLSNVG